MQEKMIALGHHADDYECMWNGIEDLYAQSTSEKLPPNFFFVLSSFGSFCYLKTPKSDLKRMVVLGDGRTKKMYEFLAPIVGFKYRHYGYKTFEQAMKKAKAEIDAGYPAVLGALDMYYLPYFSKLYHGEHIPFHYVLMIGYNDDLQCVYLLDCGREEMQKLSYGDLRLAWDCSYKGLSNPNTVCIIRMNAAKDKYQIAKEALARKSKMFLNPQVNFIGRTGFQKFINELPLLKNELTKEEYDKMLKNMIMFFGTVPTVPNALRGLNKPDEVKFCGGFDKISRVLKNMGIEYGEQTWLEAAERFDEGAMIISAITDVVIEYLTGKKDKTEDMPKMFEEVLKIMTDGFNILGNSKTEE